MDPEHFPHALAEREYYWRDIYFANYHINHDKLNWLKYFDVADCHRYVVDFDTYDSADWKITAHEGSGTATEELIDLPCGWLKVQTALDVHDYDELTTPTATWCFIQNYPCYYEARAKTLQYIDTEFWFGFLSSGSYWSWTSNFGAIFFKDEDEPRLWFITFYNGDDTWVDTGVDWDDYPCARFAIHWDGAGNLRWFIFQDEDAPQLCIATGTVTEDVPTNCLFYAGFGVNTEIEESAVLYVDYMKVAMRRIPCSVVSSIEWRLQNQV